jgi:hypothetical protein
MKKKLIYLLIFMFPFTCSALELGANLGVYLPASLPEVDQVIKNLGLHVAFPIPNTGDLLIQGEYGGGKDATITGVLIDIRTPTPQGEFTPYFLLGLHTFCTSGMDYLAEGATGEAIIKFRLGINIGGGFMAMIKENVYWDFQIRLNSGPGKIMLIGTGVNFLL